MFYLRFFASFVFFCALLSAPLTYADTADNSSTTAHELLQEKQAAADERPPKNTMEYVFSTLSGDLYFFGTDYKGAPAAAGDVFAIAGNASIINQSISGDVFFLGDVLHMASTGSSRIQGDVHSGSGMLVVDGITIEGSLISAAERVYFSENSAVEGTTVLLADTVYLNGSFSGDVHVYATTVHAADTLRVSGTVHAHSRHLPSLPSSVATTAHTEAEATAASAISWYLPLSLLVLSVLATGVSGRFVVSSAESSCAHPFRSVLFGAGVLFLLPLSLVLLMVPFLLPVGLALFLVSSLFVILGLALGMRFLGELMLKIFKHPTTAEHSFLRSLAPSALGAVIWALLSLPPLPFLISFSIPVVIMLLAIGGVVHSEYALYSFLRSKKRV